MANRESRSLGSISSKGRINHYEDGELIFKEESVGDEMYIIENGKVEISKQIVGRKTIISILGKGDFFGEIEMFSDKPRDVTATAVGRTILVSFSMEEVLFRVQNDLQFAIQLLQALMKRLRNTNTILGTLIARAYNFSDGFIEDLLQKKIAIKIGEILVEMGYLTKKQLDRAIQKQKEIHMKNHEHRLIGEIMVENGMITHEQLRSGLAEQRIRLRNRSE
ncbi:cyclic nucleotide-binding domain-containing protein [Candidatus Poribacteria bacterium]|nr:cyclic nucleotide-binding domain-containing protein [Candidatus Poribacteria bacterium]